MVVPIVSPVSAVELTRLAARLAVADEGTVVALTVVGLDADDRRVTAAQELVDGAAAAAEEAGAAAESVVVRDRSVVSAVLHAAAGRGATLILMGWKGESTHRNVFGELIDSIVGRSKVPLAVVRSRPEPFQRVVLPVSQDHLLPGGGRGLALAAGLARRLRGAEAVTVLRTGEPDAALPEEVRSLGDRVHHDPRRVDLAVGAAAGPEDLVVIPVAPTASGLRTATTHMAWAAPDPWLLVAIDVGPAAPEEGIAEAVSEAGTTPRTTPSSGSSEHAIGVTARCDRDGALDARALASTLRRVGSVGDVEELPDGDAGTMIRAVVLVTAPDANVAVGAVLSAVHESDALLGTEVTYDVRS